MSRSVRMVDVAKLAGVSAMTISRVLNGTAKVNEQTRERVFAAIATLRYQPNEVARSLREKRSRQIGVLVPYLFDPFFAMCANAISIVARQHAYTVVLATSNEEPETELEEASRMLRRNVEGLVVIPTHKGTGPSPFQSPEFERLPMVTLDRPIEGAAIDHVLVENRRGALLGTQHLIQLGHRNIAFVGLPQELYTMRERHAGYRDAMADAGLEARPSLTLTPADDTLDRLRLLLRRPDAPTAFFCANNLTTQHVLHGLQGLGVSLPDDVALVGFDDFETAALIRPGITVVRQPVELLGQTAATTLFERLGRGSAAKGSTTTVLPVDLVVRGSCGARQQMPARIPATRTA